jgi:putative transposase
MDYTDYNRVPQMTVKNDLVSSGRGVSDMKAHLVLTTKYRRKAFTGEMLTRLHEILADLCQKWDCKLIEVNGEEDHIHLLFQYYPQMDLSKFVNNIKSVTSRRIRSEFAEHVNKIYWKDVLWNESYFIASCGGVTVSVLRQYIEQQNRPDNSVD